MVKAAEMTKFWFKFKNLKNWRVLQIHAMICVEQKHFWIWRGGGGHSGSGSLLRWYYTLSARTVFLTWGWGWISPEIDWYNFLYGCPATMWLFRHKYTFFNFQKWQKSLGGWEQDQDTVGGGCKWYISFQNVCRNYVSKDNHYQEQNCLPSQMIRYFNIMFLSLSNTRGIRRLINVCQ